MFKCVIPTGQRKNRSSVPVVDFQAIYEELFHKYVAVGSNACAQFAILNGCTHAASLWSEPGDVQPDNNCVSLYKSPSIIPGLLCVVNPPDPNFNRIGCPPGSSIKVPPLECAGAAGTGGSENLKCANVPAACNCPNSSP